MSRTVSRVMYQMIIYLDLTLPPDSSDLPESKDGQSTFLFGLASDGVYRAMSVTSHAVVSYTAFPPLHVSMRFISVALSLKSPSPDVIRHPAL